MKHKKILHWDDERSDGNGIIVTSAHGWAFEPHADHNNACHVRGYDTVREARADLRRIAVCTCLRCASQGRLG